VEDAVDPYARRRARAPLLGGVQNLRHGGLNIP
jgi:hypothetical protein